MYLELCTKPKLLCDFYSVIQVLVDRSEIDRSELLAPCLKCILNRLPNKMYNDVLVSKSMCQIKHFGVCFPLTCKASSKFITLFFLHPLQKELLRIPGQTEGQETPAITLQAAFCSIWCVQVLLVTLLAPFPFYQVTTDNTDNKNTPQVLHHDFR